MISGLGALILFATIRDTPKSVGLPELEGTESADAPKDDSDVAAAKEFIVRHVFKNPLIWILCFANFFVYVVRFGILDWGPTLLSQSKHVTLEHAGWLVAGFEISGITGIMFAGWATDKFLKGKSHQSCMFCMIGAAIMVAIFWFLPAGMPSWIYSFALCGAGFWTYFPR